MSGTRVPLRAPELAEETSKTHPDLEHRTLRHANRILIEGDPTSDQAADPQGREVTRPVPAPGRADRWISRAATATVAGLAGIAGAISYSHMRQLASAHGDTGWHAHALPLSVDSVEIVASLVLLADRRVGRKSGWLPWAALTIGTAASHGRCGWPHADRAVLGVLSPRERSASRGPFPQAHGGAGRSWRRSGPAA